MLNKLIQTGLALFISTLFIWIVGYFFCNSLTYYKQSPQLNKLIHAPFTIYKHRSEGIASTHKGLFGINAINDITKDKREKIAIWGDSYVEGHHVDDKYKIPQVVTKKLTTNNQIMSFGIGMSGDSVADYFFDIPKYEQLTQSITAHYVIITSINDILPDQSSDTKRGLFKSNPFEIYHDNWQPKFQQIKRKLNNFGLYFIWQPIRSFISSVRKISFAPNPKQKQKKSNQILYSNEFLQESWEFLLSELRKQTSTPITFVYCPHIPKIKHNQILVKDLHQEQIELFSLIAKQHNIQVINASRSFIGFYENTGLFPRGFSNSKPGEGHFNMYGHKTVAELIVDHLKKRGNI